MSERILLSHGSGGLENHHLIQEMFVDAFSNPTLCSMDDAAVLHMGDMAVSTDSFTVSPLFFPGEISANLPLPAPQMMSPCAVHNRNTSVRPLFLKKD